MPCGGRAGGRGLSFLLRALFESLASSREGSNREGVPAMAQLQLRERFTQLLRFLGLSVPLRLLLPSDVLPTDPERLRPATAPA